MQIVFKGCAFMGSNFHDRSNLRSSCKGRSRTAHNVETRLKDLIEQLIFFSYKLQVFLDASNPLEGC